jgi:hypothetical protein
MSYSIFAGVRPRQSCRKTMMAADDGLTIALAVGGFMLSTFLGALKMVEFLRDRPKIKVSVRASVRLVPVTHPYRKADLISIIVVNKGRRPMTITGAALLFPRQSQWKFLFCDDLESAANVTLTENTQHDCYCGEEKVGLRYGLSPKKYVALAKDTTGRFHWSMVFVFGL